MHQPDHRRWLALGRVSDLTFPMEAWATSSSKELDTVILAAVQLIGREGGHEDLQIVAAFWLAARRRAQTAAPCRSPLKKKPETKVPRRFRMPCILPLPATNGLPHPGSAQSRGQVRPATGINRPAPEGTAAPEPLATGFP
jgi:hypothetical protein